jgi:hypothetical protein
MGNVSLEIDDGESLQLVVLQESCMAENEKEAYLALIAAGDPEIRTLLDQGFEFVTNAFKANAAPAGMKGRTDRDHMRRLQREGYEVAISAAYDDEGQARSSLSAIWRKKR